MINEQIHSYIQENKKQILEDFITLLKIPSISDTDEAKNILYKIKSLYETNGFSSELYEDYLLSHYKKDKKTIGLFAHADVVPVDDKWTKAKPFEPKIIDGELFARGATDDKGAIIISLYAMKILKELNIPFNSSLLCFTGANEETSMNDIKSYVKSHTPPDFSLVLDAAFPVYYGDKGLLWLLLTFNDSNFEDLIDLNGGNAYNIILGEATAKVKYSLSLYNELLFNEGITVTKKDDVIEIFAKGISSHGAIPYNSVNAGGIILEVLNNAKHFSKNDKKQLAFPLKLLTTYDGEALNIKSEDEIYRDTTVSNGILRIENGKLKLSIDIRYGNSFTPNMLISHIQSVLEKENASFEVIKDGAPHHTNLDNKYIDACIRAYREHTCDFDAKPRINAGGTYLRFLSNSVEVGTATKYNGCNLPQGHGGAHQPNEHINIDGFFEALEIIVKMLIECDKVC
ncbi:MAG: Sapep family Mn(2+)-dependent dipeptidase [Clostridia bacterium]|nr:Sapep family Mn(2+)-dependent dipeptidase [Clostridia bacterium]